MKKTFQDHQRHLQQILLMIPKGRVTTYKAVAQAMGFKAYRLVGQLLNKNPEPDAYPCYRVVKTDGSLGGFALGCKDKIARLKADGIEVSDGKIVDFEHKFYSIE